MPLFQLESDTPVKRKSDAKALVAKAKGKKPITGVSPKSAKPTSQAKAELKIETAVKLLDSYPNKHQLRMCNDETELAQYVTNCLDSGMAAIDTETYGINDKKEALDPMLCGFLGLCLYTPAVEHAIYVPVAHQNMAGELYPNQMALSAVSDAVRRLKECDKLLMHNAKFDIRVCRHTLGVDLPIFWDTMIASKLMNENEPAGLKQLYNKYVALDDPVYSFSTLFSGIDLKNVPPESAAIYGAEDAKSTYELFKFQEDYLKPDGDNGLGAIYDRYQAAELPVIKVFADMEDAGVLVDKDSIAALDIKYKEQCDALKSDFERTLYIQHGGEIEAFRESDPRGEKLSDPISISSPTQIAILFYDILKLKYKSRSTDAEAISTLAKRYKMPALDSLLKFREASKIYTTYIAGLPKLINPNDGKVRTNFNQYGAATGRVSSNSPNLQNIPAHNTDIRPLYIAEPGCVLISSDLSQQEPRLLAAMSRDENMLKIYQEGKDTYSAVAAIAYALPYEECREFRPDGTTNKAGKDRRSACKAIVLGIMYDKGVKAIAEDLHITKAKAQEVYDAVLHAFPKLKTFRQESLQHAKEYGYVTTITGRKRRLPDLLLPPYEVYYDVNAGFDVLNFDTKVEERQVPALEKNKWIRIMQNTRWSSDRGLAIAQAKEQGIVIRDNGGFIAKAEREVVNSRIQGSAADQTKTAMIQIANDPQLREWGSKLLLTLHDEVIVQAPVKNAKLVGERVKDIMEHCFDDYMLPVPSKCDLAYMYKWSVEVDIDEELAKIA
jgi:DNA polymerase I-like protein with 3'-5' exonuclease and polymerase domains